ncbi:RING/U-box [Glarea lozoyensis ATCC 20868]|uniref:RING/U-box n=1 Tax=Glarea lozoyensis (strain ATCC 20868 / MF5171) TaxID=1116229 RepID=S3CZH9_GLAL2|nr:RING/U-box [Glarea lozoyensis ATCC 20868]EPE25231.1 RING/U-box [Glarea lozoyensis ATCC 20868]
MCRTVLFKYERCQHLQPWEEAMYTQRCLSYQAHEVCEGLVGLEVPLDRPCDFCVDDPLAYEQLTWIEELSDYAPTEARKRFETVLRSHPSIGQTTIKDPSGTEHPYDPESRHDWNFRMPIADLEFIHYLDAGLHMTMTEMFGENQVLSMELINWYAKIRTVYRRALARFIIDERVNGFVQHRLDYRPGRHTDILCDRLCGISTMIPNTSPELHGEDCPYCLEPLYQSTEQAIRLPCGRHLIGLECTRQWISCWDFRSPLRVCILCNTDFDITKPVHFAARETLPGFEPAPDGVVPGSDAVEPFLDNLIDKRVASGIHDDTPSPWWVNLLREYA